MSHNTSNVGLKLSLFFSFRSSHRVSATAISDALKYIWCVPLLCIGYSSCQSNSGYSWIQHSRRCHITPAIMWKVAPNQVVATTISYAQERNMSPIANTCSRGHMALDKTHVWGNSNRYPTTNIQPPHFPSWWIGDAWIWCLKMSHVTSHHLMSSWFSIKFDKVDMSEGIAATSSNDIQVAMSPIDHCGLMAR